MKPTTLLGKVTNRIAWKAEVGRTEYQLRVVRDRPMSARDAKTFHKVLEVWRPENERPIVILHWEMTNWCNYACPYCIQTHGRFEKKGAGLTAHGFDNFPVEKWLEAFDRHFADRRIAFTLTGGEPFIDRVAMRKVLTHLNARENVLNIRIDTNGWWKPDDYSDIDKSKITLMVTLHPSQTTYDKFAAKIDAILGAGFRIGIVNYVMSAENMPHYLEARELLKRSGVPLHPNPLWDSKGQYSKEDLALLKQTLPEDDYGYRTSQVSPCGGKCLRPTLAYNINYKGEIEVTCFEHMGRGGSIFDDELPPLFRGPATCPHRSCVALDQYSFQAHLNRNTGADPLKIYGDLMREYYGIPTSAAAPTVAAAPASQSAQVAAASPLE